MAIWGTLSSTELASPLSLLCLCFAPEAFGNLCLCHPLSWLKSDAWQIKLCGILSYSILYKAVFFQAVHGLMSLYLTNSFLTPFCGRRMTTALKSFQKPQHQSATTHPAQTDAWPIPRNRRTALCVFWGELKLWPHNGMLKTTSGKTGPRTSGTSQIKERL